MVPQVWLRESLAQTRSLDDTRSKCNASACEGCGGDGSEVWTASIEAPNGGQASFGNGISWGKSWDPDIEFAVREEGGTKYWLFYSHAMCTCRLSEDYNLPASVGGRIELTLMQKVQQFLGLFKLPSQKRGKS